MDLQFSHHNDFWSCKDNQSPQISNIPHQGVIAEKAMVVSAREEASEIGLAILKQGGNAFDAMMATEMALAVCYPFAGNLGGGGFWYTALSMAVKAV